MNTHDDDEPDTPLPEIPYADPHLVFQLPRRLVLMSAAKPLSHNEGGETASMFALLMRDPQVPPCCDPVAPCAQKTM